MRITTVLYSRFPTLINRISRSAKSKNLRKINLQKEKLGEKYRPIGREKRHQIALLQQKPPESMVKSTIDKFLVRGKVSFPHSIRPGSPRESIAALAALKQPLAKKAKNDQKKSIRLMEKDQIKFKPKVTGSTTVLTLPSNAVPAPAYAVQTVRKPAQEVIKEDDEHKQLFSHTPVELKTKRGTTITSLVNVHLIFTY
jgi:hypothetical protein